MTKKHFEAIASLINAEVSINRDNQIVTEAFRYFAGSMAGYFVSENPRFDRDRFLKACGFESKQT